MPRFGIPIWKKSPFIRPLISLVTGILLQSHLDISPDTHWIILLCCLPYIFFYSRIGFFNRFKLGFINGLCFFGLFSSLGSLLTINQQITSDPHWFGHHFHEKRAMIISLDEPLQTKPGSFKANAKVLFLLSPATQIPAKGKIIIYFKKDSSLLGNSRLSYGTCLLIRKMPEEVKSSGNPGSFDYREYAARQNITHQVYLEEKDFIILPENKKTWLKNFILNARQELLNTLRKNISSAKELGLAEALLIGYKDDLDKSLVESYTNTGVIHVIAISGLHLGLIYWLLVLFFDRFRTNKILRSILIIAGLWLFALMAGGQPSVLRSALMFSCIVIGNSFSRSSPTLNTLACSAFILLCINPFWLWDIGFQLSYSAVLSIILFMKPIYNLIYFRNKGIDLIWQLNAVTLAAQILTTPVSIFHFHQFPNYFLLTNFIAVPLSSLILIGEILLCAVWFLPFLAKLMGKLVEWLISIMNSYIEKIERIPYALSEALTINIPQTILLYVFIAGVAYWLLEKNLRSLITAIVAIAAFGTLRVNSFFQTEKQQKIIVYNIPGKLAIDLIDARNSCFIGDPVIQTDKQSYNFHIKPSRTIHRVTPRASLPHLIISRNFIDFHGLHILIAGSSMNFERPVYKQTIDILIIYGNPGIYFARLHNNFHIKQVVFCGKNPEYKLKFWKQDCDSLNIPYHELNVKGAFVFNPR